MKTFHASAPTKVIIAGEHSAVYGGMALAAPLNNKKSCVCKLAKIGGIRGKISVTDIVGNGTYYSDGRIENSDGWFLAKARLIAHILKSENKALAGLDIKLRLSTNKIPKGTGHSASTAAVMALCLYRAFGITPTEGRLFESVQAFETIAHGGNPSGVDAKTVLSGSALRFRKLFSPNGNTFDFEKLELELPKGCALLVINTLGIGGLPQTTSEMIAKFASANEITLKPGELSARKREDLTAPYDDIVEKILRELTIKGNASELGSLFDKNHALLKKAGVSNGNIEEAIRICKQNGALGAKITGAGGMGGAIIALCKKQDAKKILREIGKIGISGVEAQFATKGADIV